MTVNVHVIHNNYSTYVTVNSSRY